MSVVTLRPLSSALASGVSRILCRGVLDSDNFQPRPLFSNHTQPLSCTFISGTKKQKNVPTSAHRSDR